MQRILIVEDEIKTGSYLRQGLEEVGYHVELFHNGREGLNAILKGHYELIILDIMLPSLNGWQIIEEMRKFGHEEPVLFLTAKDNVQDKVKGLELGADDYLIKPFDFAELVARVRTLLRRSRALGPTVSSLADLTVDMVRRTVIRSGKRIHLTSKEYILLELLLQRTGEVLPRSLISSLVWNMNFDSDTNVIDVAVRRLRSKIDDDFEPKLIHTVRGTGYVLEIKEE
ncbi:MULTISPECIES: heavy metal response regulator transcription factor [Serratia]|jgi:two-component system, OmpR family, copper resistance phosphate regulon response regulator CusR|uniref:heavy metal response regulator transcription factor n=1 Tax=Serratia TaxID=613 RepID=UPI001A34EF6A|nr:heavy metal response regulator transcription factor [Serratia liquefaciens]EKN4908431.1 heavy metal response regulator transcription factor [Yersinia enterocolitica]HAT3731505.1 heavy metal response regulator transcription factor [Serratia marcescens]HDM8374012.1 heavy metal response regulator transcription factor [Yersinia enterocolitica]HEN3244208.1 heavy metal response regulator transcription factor [Yersinia enterocolitica]HEN3450921.1 heavy metal response regulator transcription factor